MASEKLWFLNEAASELDGRGAWTEYKADTEKSIQSILPEGYVAHHNIAVKPEAVKFTSLFKKSTEAKQQDAAVTNGANSRASSI